MSVTRIELVSKVGPDGVLHVDIPVGPDGVNAEYRVVAEPLLKLANASEPTPDGEPWADFVRRTAGSIPDSSFRRHEQDAPQERDPL